MPSISEQELIVLRRHAARWRFLESKAYERNEKWHFNWWRSTGTVGASTDAAMGNSESTESYLERTRN